MPAVQAIYYHAHGMINQNTRVTQTFGRWSSVQCSHTSKCTYSRSTHICSTWTCEDIDKKLVSSSSQTCGVLWVRCNSPTLFFVFVLSALPTTWRAEDLPRSPSSLVSEQLRHKCHSANFVVRSFGIVKRICRDQSICVHCFVILYCYGRSSCR